MRISASCVLAVVALAAAGACAAFRAEDMVGGADGAADGAPEAGTTEPTAPPSTVIALA